MSHFQFIGSNVVRLGRVDSTNNYARDLIRDKTSIEGTIIVADEQTEGRGQRSNSWLTEPNKNLTCSYILKPVFLAAKDQFLLSACVALAVFETVSHFVVNHDIRIKWPNDVLIDDRKVAGILIENSLRGTMLETSIVGIGLNVNQHVFQQGLNATSLSSLVEEDIELDKVLEKLSECVEKYYFQLREGKFEAILRNYNDHLFAANKPRMMSINGHSELVKIAGAKHSGELELQRADGTHTLHQHHEIAWNLDQ